MKLFIVVGLGLFLFFGCAGKVVPGKAVDHKNIITAKEFAKEAVVKPEKKESEVPRKEVLPPVTKEQVIVEKVGEEKPKVRFSDFQLISSEPYKITMKTRKFAFSDTGFLKVYDKAINLQVFTMGKLALDLEVDLDEEKICVDGLCNSKQGFNQTFLTEAYPDDLVEKVLEGKPVLGGKKLKKTVNGFMQKIITGAYEIKYKVWPGNIYFKDSKNAIMIKLKKLSK